MSWLIQTLREYPELAFFLTLSLGYAVGKIRIGSFTIGSVAGLKTSGLSFFITGVIVTLVPIIIGILIGKYLFKWNGALCSCEYIAYDLGLHRCFIF